MKAEVPVGHKTAATFPTFSFNKLPKKVLHHGQNCLNKTVYKFVQPAVKAVLKQVS